MEVEVEEAEEVEAGEEEDGQGAGVGWETNTKHGCVSKTRPQLIPVRAKIERLLALQPTS